jgi:hypothetical protein
MLASLIPPDRPPRLLERKPDRVDALPVLRELSCATALRLSSPVLSLPVRRLTDEFD